MKQPKALIPLFFNEMWERFGYYSIQALLVLFLIHQQHFSDANAFVTLGVFVSLVYIAPLFGGLLADRFLGYRYSILWGSILLCLGYLLLAYGQDYFLHLSLGTIIVGNGLLKPNNAAFLGQFYYYDDFRRYPGFTFYYIGINLGGLLSIATSSLASQYIGYHTAFAISGFGMLLAIGVFIYGFRYFENRGLPDPQQFKNRYIRAMANHFNLFILLLIGILLFHFLLHRPRLTEILTIIVAIVVTISLFYLQTTYNQTTRNKLIAVIILIAASIIFWAIHLQIFFSLMLFTEREVDRMFFHYTVPTPLFIILEPILILLIGPLFARFWEWLSYRRREPSPSYKFAFALISIGIGMGILFLAVLITPSQKLINCSWLILFYLFLTIGELFISPTGLAMITELAPSKLTGFMLGVWYMVLGLGGLLAGILARLVLTSPNIKLQIVPLNSFSYAFSTYAVLALLTGFFLLLIAPQINKLMYVHNE